MPKKASKRDTGWMKHAGIGIEFAGAVGAFIVLGWWIDRHWDTKPWGIVICALLGLIGGFYNLLKAALKAAEEAENKRDDQSVDQDQ